MKATEEKIGAKVEQSRTSSVAPRRPRADCVFFHANPNKASELGRKGGRGKRQVMLHDADPLPALDSAESVCNFSARLTAEVYSGERSTRAWREG